MTRLVLIAFMAISPLLLWAQKSKYFFNTINTEYAASMSYDAAGDIWTGCMLNDQVQLIKMNKFGEKIDEVRIRVDGGQNYLSQIIVDSEGKIAGCGNYSTVFNGDRSFVFRYDPVTREVLWTKTLTGDFLTLSGMVEKVPGTDYLLLANSLELSADLIGINKATGVIAAGTSKSYTLGLGKQFDAAIQHKDFLYFVGGEGTPTFINDKFLSTLTKIDPTTNEVVWSRQGPFDLTNSSVEQDIFARDVVADNDTLVVVSAGPNPSGGQQINEIYLEKYDVDGGKFWTKRFNIPSISAKIVDEIALMNDGYLVYGRMGDTATFSRFMFKTDKEGNLKWAKKIGKQWKDDLAFLDSKQGEVLVGNDGIFVLTSSTDGIVDQSFFFKTDLNGNIDGCDFIQPLAIQEFKFDNPLNATVAPVSLNTKFILQNNSSTKFNTSDLEIKTPCSVPDDCSLADLNIKLDSVTCNGTRELYLTVCNVGKGDMKADVKLSIFNQDPFKGSGTIINTINVATNDLKPGDCISSKLDLSSFAASESLYALVGTNGVDAAPFDLANFPLVSGADECAYTNNLLFVRLSLPNKPDLGTDRGVCPGKSVTLDAGAGTSYLWSTNAVTKTISVNTAGLYWVELTNGCGQKSRDSIQISALNTPTRTVAVTFVKGSSVTIGGNTFTQPGTFTITVPSNNGGCDSLITYNLQTIDNQVTIKCPNDLTVTLPTGTLNAKVDYNLPSAETNCPDKTITYTLLQGPPVGGSFLPGITKVCYQATDKCGGTATCCFNVEVQEANSCDTKVNGCIRYEVFSIKRDAAGNKRYRFRITNNCNSEMNWVAFQMPNGITAVSPATNSVITSANGRKYEVRNPNTNPFHSIRFKTQADGITAGKSDVFEYILPPQANPNYLLSQVRLANGETYQAHMSLTSCPVEAAKPAFVDGTGAFEADEVKVFPNPANDLITVALPEQWLLLSTQVEVLNLAGQVVQRGESPAGQPLFALPLDAALSNGIYFLRLRNAGGQEQSLRFAVQR